MLSLLITALALGQAGVGSWPDRCRDRSSSRTRTCESYAQFEFAPANGAGMGAACACTTPTGAKGEALTFTRASSGTCLKGGTVSGIANGDMVTCSTNQARVMPGGSGTGPLGLLVEGTGTNLVLRSEEFENAAWNTLAAGVAAPTVTADQASGPNTNQVGKADRVQFPAITAAQTSMIFTASSIGGAGHNVCSLFVRGNGTSDASGIDLVKYNSGVATYDAVRCPYTSTGWTRCETPPTNGASTTFACYIGHAGVAFSPGLTARSAADVFLIGAQGEAGTFATSYIATTSAAATRDNEIADFVIATSGWAGISEAASYVGGPALSLLGTNPVLMPVLGDATLARYLYTFRGGSATYLMNAQLADPGAATDVTAFNVGALTSGRFVSYSDGSKLFACSGGSCSSGTSITWGPPSFIKMRVGTYNTAQGYNFGVTKQVCLDPSPTRCR